MTSRGFSTSASSRVLVMLFFSMSSRFPYTLRWFSSVNDFIFSYTSSFMFKKINWRSFFLNTSTIFCRVCEEERTENDKTKCVVRVLPVVQCNRSWVRARNLFPLAFYYLKIVLLFLRWRSQRQGSTGQVPVSIWAQFRSRSSVNKSIPINKNSKWY